MKKTTLVKLLCLVVFCALLLPMVFACGEDTPPLNSGSSNTTNSSAGDNTNNSGNNSTTEKVTINFRGNGKGTEFEGETTAQVDKGGKLDVLQVPTVYRDGFEFDYWAYDSKGDNQWQTGDIFNENTILYAIWVEDASGDDNQGGTNSSLPGTDSSLPGTDSSLPGTDSSVPGGTNPPAGDEKITIEFNTGVGYFEDANLYEVEIDKGGRLSSLPTPIHENPAMLFEGWYKDANCTIAVSRSDKYDASTMIYANWIEQAECTDGTYNHLYSTWDVDTQPSCTKPGTYARYCSYCNDKQTKQGDPAKGHQFGQWEEAFMSRKRTCARLGCGETEVQNFQDVTLEVLGVTPGNQIEGNSDAFYNVPFTALVNGTWDEGHGKFVGPKGNGTAYIIFTFVEPTALDRIYFKGDGSVNMSIYVQYEGEDDFTNIGICGGVSEKESTPFKTPDPTKKIVKVKFQEDNPQNGTSQWQEVAFVKVAVDEE